MCLQRYGSHTKQLVLDLSLLNVLQIRTYQIGAFMFRYDRGLLLIMISSVMYPRFIHITLEIPQSIAAFLLAQIHGDSPLDSWEFRYGKKFHSQFACLRTFTFLKGNYAHTSLVKL